MYGDGPSSYDTPHEFLVGQIEMSLVRVQPPHVHQHVPLSDALATAAVLLGQPPGLVGGISGIYTPEFMTSWIHCFASSESVGGVTSSLG